MVNLPLKDDLNFRVFEAMSCGALLLTRRVANGQELLFEEGVHFAASKTEAELLEKIDYYLSHESERTTIATAGLAEIQANPSIGASLGRVARNCPKKSQASCANPVYATSCSRSTLCAPI